MKISVTAVTVMTSRIHQYLPRISKGRTLAVLGILAVALAVELLDAGVGFQTIAGDRLIAADSIVDIADVAVVAAAAWLVRLRSAR